VNVQKLLKEVRKLELLKDEQQENDENPDNDQDFKISCNTVRSEFRKFVDIDKIMSRSALLKFLNINTNSYGRFMSFHGLWQGVDNSMYQLGAPFFRRWKMAKKNLKLPTVNAVDSAAATTSKNKKKESSAKAAYAELLDQIAAQEPTWPEDQLGDEHKMMVYLNCDEVRQQIFDFLHKHNGVTSRTSFAKDLGFTPRPLLRFLQGKGEFDGAKSDIYFRAYDFFERLRKLDKRPVPPGREEIDNDEYKEWRYSMGGRRSMGSSGFIVKKGE
jgi:hypothetical protein